MSTESFDSANWRPRVLVLPASYLAASRSLGGGERYALEFSRALSAHTPVTHALFGLEDQEIAEGSLALRIFGLTRLDQRRGLGITSATWRAFGYFDVVHLMVYPSMATDLLILSATLRG